MASTQVLEEGRAILSIGARPELASCVHRRTAIKLKIKSDNFENRNVRLKP
jgi:hypothetical protein